MIEYQMSTSQECTVDAVGSSQIFFHTQNLERAYSVDEEFEAFFFYVSNTTNMQGLRSKKL